MLAPVLALLVLGALVVGAVAVVQRPALLSQALPGVADCTATDGEREVDLSTSQAERAAQAAARAMRLDLQEGTTTMVLIDRLELPEADAEVVSRALKGERPGALTCVHGGSGESDPDELDRTGLTPRTAELRSALEQAFGEQQLGGFAPGGVDSGHMRGSKHYEGRAIDVFFRPVTEENLRNGWSVAHYLVAHADRLGVETVIFDRQIWTARRAVQGWRPYEPDTSGRSPEVAEILEHREHVHVDVSR